MRKTLAVLMLAMTPLYTFAQTEQNPKGLKVADKFITGYNEQNYTKIHKPYSLVVRVLMSKKKLKQWLAPKYQAYGKIISGSEDIKAQGRSVSMTLKYEKDPGQVDRIGFYLNKKGKIIGMSVKSDPFVFTRPAAGTNTADEIDAILRQAYPAGFNGAVLYAHDGQVLFERNYGYADMDKKIPINDSTMFELASCSKQFTAAAILKLQELGKLSVEDSLSKFFPQLPYPGIQIKHLVWHTAGLPDYMGPLMKKKVNKSYCFNEDVIDYLATGKDKRAFAPGERHQYSNTGYAVLASVIEKASGMSYANFLEEYFFKPLNMTHTRVYNTRRTKGEVIDNYAYGYVYVKGKYLLPDSAKDYKGYITKLDGIVGDGTVNTTVYDLVKWDEGLRNHTVLSSASLDSANVSGYTNSGKRFDYGYGVSVNKHDVTGKIISHTGGWPGYQTVIYRFPDKKQMLVLLCNKEHPDSQMQMAARKISSLFIYR